MNSMSLWCNEGLPLEPCKTTFPTEIVDNIAGFMIHDRSSFSDIAGFASTCYYFRQIAFRRYFVILRASTKSQWYRRCHIPGVFLWVRNIQCNSTALYVRPAMLQQFVHLESITISFHTEGRNTQYTSTRLILKHLPPTLTQLTLECLPIINSSLIGLITTALPGLRSLRLTCSERLTADLNCCWDCYEEGGSQTVHSPIPNYYCDVYDLVECLGQSLAPLRELEELFLGIFLSNEEIFFEHIEHTDDLSESFGVYGPDECSLCEELYAEEIRAIEMNASAEMAQYIPSLKMVSWSSFFARGQPGDDPIKQQTTMWVKRDDGTLAVKRAQW